ncbi:MAG: methyltransferase domain-containing protein [Paucimonas sp.]|nr:methyltransferase domain-containing protein [Paucimonas sp.]
MHQSANPSDPCALTGAHDLQPCWDLQLAGLGADALHLALECGLFDQLQEFAAPHEVAGALCLDHANTGYLLELLWSMNLLQRDVRQRYRNTPLAADYLRQDAPTYCGDALLFRHKVMRQTGEQLGDLLRNGSTAPPALSDAIRRGWANAARVQIAQEQRAVTAGVACALLETLPEYPRLERILDLGGGPGLVAVALARRLPALRGVVFEYPECAAVAADNIAAAALDTRLQAVGGDLDQDDFGEGYDLIWCSSVLHFVKDLPAVLDRLHAALKPGGVLVCCQAEVPAVPKQAGRVLPYYLHMRMHGRHVLAEGELARLLRSHGYQRVQQLNDLRFPVTPVNAVIARKEQP